VPEMPVQVVEEQVQLVQQTQHQDQVLLLTFLDRQLNMVAVELDMDQLVGLPDQAATGLGYGGWGGQYATGGTAGANGVVIIRYIGVGINSFALAANATTTHYQTTSTININLTAPATVAFYANGKKITNCAKVRTTGTSPNIVASCNWKPSNRGNVYITSTSTSTSGGAPASSSPIKVFVSSRSTTR
jgi:hypothetical protein